KKHLESAAVFLFLFGLFIGVAMLNNEKTITGMSVMGFEKEEMPIFAFFTGFMIFIIGTAILLYAIKRQEKKQEQKQKQNFYSEKK
ncbi:MAG: hypothetical protein ACP5H9_02970, partial [Candidatus Woesearchaeota archaeon]